MKLGKMTFAAAKGFSMPFGKFRGQKVDEIAETDEGLLYLDWLRGWIEGKDFGQLREALEVYLDDPNVKKELEELVR